MGKENGIKWFREKYKSRSEIKPLSECLKELAWQIYQGICVSLADDDIISEVYGLDEGSIMDDDINEANDIADIVSRGYCSLIYRRSKALQK